MKLRTYGKVFSSVLFYDWKDYAIILVGILQGDESSCHDQQPMMGRIMKNYFCKHSSTLMNLDYRQICLT